MMKEAMLYEKGDGGVTTCRLCAHRCTVKPGKRGVCGVRENRDGVLYSLVYGAVIAANVDPIEKKPLFHVYPGSRSFSIATAGCNFRCTFCQNSDISQMPRDRGVVQGRAFTPEEIVAEAAGTGSKTIAYTYTEPTVYFELAYDSSRLARARDIRNVFVTNGFMTGEALDAIAPYLDAANVDLKSFSDQFYVKQCGARLQPVLDSLRKMKELGIWVEITTLLIPTLNDGDDELKDIAAFIKSLGPETPWHISRFHPDYRLTNLPVTTVAALHRAAGIGKSAGLKYVYTGNVPGDEGENTWCAKCGALLIGRYGFRIAEMNLSKGACRKCGTALDGIIER